MNLVIRLPGSSDESDRSLAPQVATLAVAYLQGVAEPAQAPAGTENACQNDPACEYLGKVTDVQGVVWLLYICNGEFKLYRA